MSKYALVVVLAALGAACTATTALDGLADHDETLPGAAGTGSGAGEAKTTYGEGSEVSAVAGGERPDGSTVDIGSAAVCPTNADRTLVAWYPFDEGTGNTVTDCSGSGFHGRPIGSTTVRRVAGRIRGAIDLDGESGCLDLGLAPALVAGDAGLTVAAWLRPRRFSAPQPDGGTNPTPRWFVGHFSSATRNGWGVGSDDSDALELKVFRAGAFFEAETTSVAKNVWIHFTAVYKAGSVSVYVAGALADERATTLVPGVDVTAHGFIGCRGGVSNFWDGALDDLRVYRRVLSAAEIAALAR